MLEGFDPTTIEDEGLRQVVIFLMNLVETLSGKVAEQAEEIQRLRDEINRLKGEQGKPKSKANKRATDLSSEKDRREPKTHQKSTKQAHIQLDREVVVKVEQELLPADAVGKRVGGRGGPGHRLSHGQHPVPQREIFLAQSQADVSGLLACRLHWAVWAGGEGLGAGAVLWGTDE